MTERELVKGCLQEKKKHQLALYQRYAGKMFVICLRYARHRMEAEDLLQDAFIKVYDNLAKFKFTGSLEGWIRRIVINTALKAYGKKSFQNEDIGLEKMVERKSDPSILASINEEELLKLVSRLPDGYRIVFNLYAIEGYSHKEIADLLGIKESTSRSQLVKARKLLQQQIEEIQKIVA